MRAAVGPTRHSAAPLPTPTPGWSGARSAVPPDSNQRSDEHRKNRQRANVPQQPQAGGASKRRGLRKLAPDESRAEAPAIENTGQQSSNRQHDIGADVVQHIE